MKVVFNILKGFIFSAWLLVAIITTVCLLSFNEKGVSVFGNSSLLIMDNNELEPTFKKNDVVIVKKNDAESYKLGDTVFFYGGSNSTQLVRMGEITNIIPDKDEYSYEFDGRRVSYSSIIGNANGAVVYHFFGLILSIFESRWGYMFLVILPTLFLLVYQIYEIVIEVKREVKIETKKLKKAKK